MNTNTVVAIAWIVVGLVPLALYVVQVVHCRRNKARLRKFNKECTRLWTELFSLESGTPEYEAAWQRLCEFTERECLCNLPPLRKAGGGV